MNKNVMGLKSNNPLFRTISKGIKSPVPFRRNSKNNKENQQQTTANQLTEIQQDQIVIEDSIREENYAKKLNEVNKKMEEAELKMKEAENRIKYSNDRAKEIEERWNLMQKQDESVRKIREDEKILLNVGGAIFTTSKTSLLSTQYSYFYAMLSSEFWKPNKDDGAYFIDRDPKHFLLILNYMRTGKLNMTKLNEEEILELYDDMSYYQLCPYKIYWDPAMVGNLLNLSECNRRVAYTSNTTEEGTYSGAISITSSDRYKFKINTLKKSKNVVIGFSEKQEFKNNDETWKNGYYLYLKTGAIVGQSIPELTKDYTTKTIRDGTVIEAYYENNEIGFIIDDEDCGIAFSNVENKILYPALSLNSDCDVDISLLDFY